MIDPDTIYGPHGRSSPAPQMIQILILHRIADLPRRYEQERNYMTKEEIFDNIVFVPRL